MAETAPAAMAARDVPVQAGVGQTASVQTACGAEDTDPLMEVSASKEQDVRSLPEALAVLAEEVETDQTSYIEAAYASATALHLAPGRLGIPPKAQHPPLHVVSTLVVWPTSAGAATRTHLRGGFREYKVQHRSPLGHALSFLPASTNLRRRHKRPRDGLECVLPFHPQGWSLALSAHPTRSFIPGEGGSMYDITVVSLTVLLDH